MPSYYDPHHPNVYESPKICGCIPLKLIALAIQAAALILQIYLICFGSRILSSFKVVNFVQILAAFYTGFTFVVLFNNDRFLMCTHFYFGICLMMFPLVEFIFYFSCVIVLWIDGDISIVRKEIFVMLFADGIISLVLFLYIVMCKALFDSLNHSPLPPEYTINQNAQQPGRIGDGLSDGAQLIYSVYPQL